MSLHSQDWMKILGGLALAATGAGLAGAGPLAGMLASGGGAAGAGAGAAGATGAAAPGFASLVAPGLVSSGIGMGTSGMLGTPTQKMVQPQGAPPMMQQSDPFDILRQIKMMKGGGF